MNAGRKHARVRPARWACTASRSTYGTVTPKGWGTVREPWTATNRCGTSRAVRHWDRAGARDQKPAAGSHQAAADGANVRRRASSGEAGRPGGAGRFLTATLDASVRRSRRALEGRAGAAWMYRWSCLGNLLGSKRRCGRSRQRCQIGARRCVGVYNGIRQGVIPQGRPDPQDQLNTYHARSHPIALARAAGQTPGLSLSQAVDEVTGSTAHSDQQETNSRGSHMPSTERPSISQLSAAPWM